MSRCFFEQAKFAAMGQMISAIAHQWRQPLNALALYTQDIEDAYDAGEVNAKFLTIYVENSMKLINHMSNTIDDFRNFFPFHKLKREGKPRLCADTELISCGYTTEEPEYRFRILHKKQIKTRIYLLMICLMRKPLMVQMYLSSLAR